MMTISKHIWEMGKRTLESGFLSVFEPEYPGFVVYFTI